jgi:hypothetical protein
MSACLRDQFPDSEVQSLKLQLHFPHHFIKTTNTFLEVKPLPAGDRRRSKSAEPLGRGLTDLDAGGDMKYTLEHLDDPSKILVDRICSTYLAADKDKRGVTLMWRQLPIRWDLADLIQVLTVTRTRDVEYVYVPVNHYTNRRVAANRNKRYAFIHFSSAASAHRFSTVISTVGGEKQMHTSIAKHQGIAANIAFLSTVTVPDKRRRNMLRANICAFANPDSEGDVVRMVSMSFLNLRNGMMSMQEASTTDRSTDRSTERPVDSDEDAW